MRYLQAFALAFNMMSIVPFFKVHDFFKGINGISAMFYPFVGFFLGSLLWLTFVLLEGLIPPTHLAVSVFALWVLLTGALHLDGFSDTIDGLFVKKEEALNVMKDSHVGGMGMTFSFVFLALKLSSVVTFNAYYLLPMVLMLSRLNATLAIYFYDYVSSGVGQLIKEELSLKHVMFSFVSTLAFVYFFAFVSAFVVAFLVLILMGRLFTHRLGGLSGDVYGFIIEVTELALLNYIIIINFS